MGPRVSQLQHTYVDWIQLMFTEQVIYYDIGPSVIGHLVLLGVCPTQPQEFPYVIEFPPLELQDVVFGKRPPPTAVDG